MTGYAIIRVEKHTTLGTVAAAGHHLDRTRETPNADAKKAHLNRTWIDGEWVAWGDEAREPGAQLEAFKSRLADFEHRGGKIQKNAVIALEAIMTASPEAFKTPGFDLEAWITAQSDYAAKRFGAENVVSMVLHLDEQTPHVHALIVPEIERIERRGKKPADPGRLQLHRPKPALSASHWVDGRAKLAALQDDYAAAMSRFGLARGKERSGARHTPVGEYYAQGEALVKEVEQLRGEVARLQQVEQQLVEARAQIDMLQSDRADLRDQLQRVRAARRADADDLGVIRTLRESLPQIYDQVVGMADREMARRAEAEIARMQQPGPGEPDPGF